jgi:hypothetical protein
MLDRGKNETNDVRDPSTAAAAAGRRLSWIVVAVSCATVVCACGSSPPLAPRADPALAYARCVRSHGVPSFPDPTASHGLVIPDDVNPQSPAFQSAERACAMLLPGGSGPGSSPESRRLQLLALARCMRRHGVPSFADPTSSPPPPGDGNVIGANGTYLAVGPPAGRQSPAFIRAAAACGLPGAP